MLPQSRNQITLARVEQSPGAAWWWTLTNTTFFGLKETESEILTVHSTSASLHAFGRGPSALVPGPFDVLGVIFLCLQEWR
jgi:hypothetical protein